jgi:hypothetical protein
MIPSFIVFHPLQLPASRDLSKATQQQKHYLEQQIMARLSILLLSKTYPLVTATSPTLDMKGFLASGVSFAKKQQRVCPYFQDFSTSSS